MSRDDPAPVAHLGNTLWRPDADTDPRPAPSAVASLAARVGAGRTLTPHSDIAALLVFDHQMHGMNLLVRTGWEVRVAQADAPATATAVAVRVAVDLVDYLLFIDEAPLAGPVEGQSGFAAAFAARGPRDRAGRSLRDLDLATRLLKHSCSYLVYSEAFDALPPVAKDAVYERLWHVLSGAERATARYARLSRGDRQAIVEILRETKRELPPYFLGAVLVKRKPEVQYYRSQKPSLIRLREPGVSSGRLAALDAGLAGRRRADEWDVPNRGLRFVLDRGLARVRPAPG